MKQNNVALESAWYEVCESIKTKEKELQAHIKIQLGIETMLQLTGNFKILLLLGQLPNMSSEKFSAHYCPGLRLG